MKLGITLYSLSLEYRTGKYTLDELIRKAGELRLGPPVEIVGFQSIRGYPAVSDEFARRFRRLLDDAGLEQSCLGANVDTGRKRSGLMDDAETVEYLSAQIDAAVAKHFKGTLRQPDGTARPAAKGKKIVVVSSGQASIS